MVNIEIRLIIFFSAKDGEALHSKKKTRPGVDYGSDHELLTAKFRLKLRFKGSRLVDRVPEEIWTEVHNIV